MFLLVTKCTPFILIKRQKRVLKRRNFELIQHPFPIFKISILHFPKYTPYAASRNHLYTASICGLPPLNPLQAQTSILFFRA